MHLAFYILWYLQAAVALLVIVVGAYWWVKDRDDIVSRYVLRALMVTYVVCFGAALLVSLVPA